MLDFMSKKRKPDRKRMLRENWQGRFANPLTVSSEFKTSDPKYEGTACNGAECVLNEDSAVITTMVASLTRGGIILCTPESRYCPIRMKGGFLEFRQNLLDWKMQGSSVVFNFFEELLFALATPLEKERLLHSAYGHRTFDIFQEAPLAFAEPLDRLLFREYFRRYVQAGGVIPMVRDAFEYARFETIKDLLNPMILRSSAYKVQNYQMGEQLVS